MFRPQRWRLSHPAAKTHISFPLWLSSGSGICELNEKPAVRISQISAAIRADSPPSLPLIKMHREFFSPSLSVLSLSLSVFKANSNWRDVKGQGFNNVGFRFMGYSILPEPHLYTFITSRLHNYIHLRFRIIRFSHASFLNLILLPAFFFSLIRSPTLILLSIYDAFSYDLKFLATTRCTWNKDEILAEIPRKSFHFDFETLSIGMIHLREFKMRQRSRARERWGMKSAELITLPALTFDPFSLTCPADCNTLLLTMIACALCSNSMIVIYLKTVWSLMLGEWEAKVIQSATVVCSSTSSSLCSEC